MMGWVSFHDHDDGSNRTWRDNSWKFSSQSFVEFVPGTPLGVYNRSPNVDSKDQPPTLIIRPALSGITTLPAQKTSVLMCISRHAVKKFEAKLKSSSYAPVEFGKPVPPFSRNVTLLLIPTVAINGTTTLVQNVSWMKNRWK